MWLPGGGVDKCRWAVANLSWRFGFGRTFVQHATTGKQGERASPSGTTREGKRDDGGELMSEDLLYVGWEQTVGHHGMSNLDEVSLLKLGSTL